MPFAGFSPAALRFLRELERHNERAWFNARKERYVRELQTPLAELVEDLSAAFARRRIPLRGERRRSVFRIYRDVRFSADKSPYKTHVAAYLSYDGERTTPGGLYVHVAPGASFLSAAFYRIERPMLLRWRAEMAARPRTFASVLRALARGGLHILGPDELDDSLARMPRGYTHLAESEFAPYFRLQSFVVHEALDDHAVGSPDLTERCVTFVRRAKPLLEYGWKLV